MVVSTWFPASYDTVRCVTALLWTILLSGRKKLMTVQTPEKRAAVHCQTVCFFQLTFLHPPVRATVGEVRYSIEIDVGGE